MKEVLKLSASFTNPQLVDIAVWRNAGAEWTDVADKFNRKYRDDRSSEAMRHAYRRYGNLFETTDNETFVKNLKEIARTKIANSKTAKENKAIITEVLKVEDVLDGVKDVIKTLKATKIRIPKVTFDSSKPDMTLELMLSDIHYGKKTPEFNLAVCRKRMQDLTRTVIREIKRNSQLYNVERLIIGLIGDIIESETMHGIESSRGSEVSNSEQVQAAIESLFLDVLVPLAATGLQIDVPAVTGNHDRTEKEKTYWLRGKSNVTWIIYNTLELLCKQSGMKNVKFHIADGIYITLDIYGNTILFEHGDEVGNTNEETLYKHMARRTRQLKKIINFMRMGHFHKRVEYGRGDIIINESVAGPDSFSDTHGFSSTAGQTLNSYIRTSERPTCFFRSFPIYLK